MGHRLYMQHGKASMMYFGEKPWHELGQEVKGPATAAEALAAAMLDYEVVKQPVHACVGRLTHSVPNRFALVRRDLLDEKHCPIYGVVGSRYRPLQNREAFEFFDPIVGSGAAIYHTAGALGEGELVWILAKLPGEIQVAGKDKVDKFLLLSNCHNGRTSVQIKFTPIRVVCYNTLTQALSEGTGVRVAHTKNVLQNLREAETTLGIIRRRFSELETAYQQMAKVKLDQQRLSAYLQLIFPDPPNASKNRRALALARMNRERAEYFFVHGKGNAERGIAGSLWAAYNGVTEYVDHERADGNPEEHLYSVWFGSGYEVKARAFNVAADRLKAWAVA